MNAIWGKIKQIYTRLTGSIAFWPSVITLGFSAMAVLVLSLDSYKINVWLLDNLSQLAVENPENARLVLGTLAGGTISLTVFSFTMVMLVLNQAGTNLSPRVIPGLITKRSHQVVLGFYLGTTLYLLLLILGFQKSEENKGIPMGGILLALIFGIVCLVLFVYFIHSISKSIQVNAVLSDIYKQGLERLQTTKDERSDAVGFLLQPHEESYIQIINSPQSGYISQMDIEGMIAVVDEHGLLVQIHARVGNFTQVGEPLIEIIKGTEQDSKIREQLLSFISYSPYSVNIEDAEMSMKRISEIGTRALSPGINDPGTAITAIDMLTALFVEQMKQPLYTIHSKNGKPRILVPIRPFELLLTKYWVPMRHYGRDNLNINLKMLYNLNTLLQHATPTCVAIIENEIQALRESTKESIQLPEDHKKIERAQKAIRKANGYG